MSPVVVWVLAGCAAVLVLVGVLGRWAYQRLRRDFERED